MAKQVQRRRGTAAENNAFTGAAGEVTVDTTANDLRVHDGSTEGGHQAGTVAASGAVSTPGHRTNASERTRSAGWRP